MSGKSNFLSNGLLAMLFNGTAISGLAENASTSPYTVFYVSLHSADPSSVGNQASYEINYPTYARIGVNRNSGGWIVTGNSVSPVGNVTFPLITTVFSGTATFWGIGLQFSGTGTLLYTGPVTPNITLTQGVTPRIGASSTITES